MVCFVLKLSQEDLRDATEGEARPTTGFVLQICFSNFIGFGHPRAPLSPSAKPDPDRTWSSTRPRSIPPRALCVSQAKHPPYLCQPLNIPWICASPVSILSPQRLHTAPSAPHPGCGAVLGVSPSQQCHQSEITAGFSETLALPSPRVQPSISVSHGAHCVTDKGRILVPGISKLDM